MKGQDFLVSDKKIFKSFAYVKKKQCCIPSPKAIGFLVLEKIFKGFWRNVDGLIRQLVSIDDSKFGFVLGRGTTDSIFVVRQLQGKYLAANKSWVP